jgi:predicted NodU family carbamoyl transferase
MISLDFDYSQMHYSSACFARDGELLFAVAEERISRIKHDAGFPDNAIWACLEFAIVRSDELDFICQGRSTSGKVLSTGLKSFIRFQYPIICLNVFISAWLPHWRGLRQAGLDLCD